MKTKKTVLALALIAVISVTSCAQQYDPERDFEASPQDGGKSVVITKYLGSKWEVRIPPRIQGLPVTHIGDKAFSNKNLVSVTIPNGVTRIENSAFSGNQLTSITIPNSIIHIGDNAFFGNQLTSITIPNSVTSIGNSVFAVCPNLDMINVAAGSSAYSTENGILYNKDKTYLHTYPNGKTAVSFTIPNNVTSIGKSAFTYCTNLTSVTIPNGVTSIGDWAFSYCTNLTGIIIPNSVTSIGDWAFVDCTNLTSVTIGNSVTRIGKYSFENCTSLTNITIPNSVTIIGSSAFSGTNLTSVTIPNSVTNIGGSAFSGTNLTSVTLQGAISSDGFASDAFPSPSVGSLHRIYLVNGGGPGTYILQFDNNFYGEWTKQ
jgi:hypothetical protein